MRRFVASRGMFNTVYCDQGTNLVGGCRELKLGLQGIDREFLLTLYDLSERISSV